MNTVEKLRELLSARFPGSVIEIQDDSAKHAGHKEAVLHGGGHFNVLISSRDFIGKSKLERHRLINSAVAQLFNDESIHALSIKALAPNE